MATTDKHCLYASAYSIVNREHHVFMLTPVSRIFVYSIAEGYQWNYHK